MAGSNINDSMVVSVWQSSAEDLSRLQSGRLKRSAIKCSTANVGSILTKTQHTCHFNYLTTRLCEKQGRWRVRPRDREEGRKRSKEFGLQLMMNIISLMMLMKLNINIENFCLRLTTWWVKNMLAVHHHDIVSAESMMTKCYYICMKTVNINDHIAVSFLIFREGKT